MKLDAIMESMLTGATQTYRAGMDNAPSTQALRAVVSAYDKALQDEESKLPTYLHLALEMARRSC